MGRQESWPAVRYILFREQRGGQHLEQRKQLRFLQMHNQGLRQLFLTVSWDLRA